MTSEASASSRNRDQQDSWEMHLFSSQEFISGAGWVMNVAGNRTNDKQAAIWNVGYGMHLPAGTEAEVALVAFGSDPNQKMAVPSIPRDKQREWKEGTSGIQNAIDPAKAIEFNAKRTHATEENIAFGPGGMFELIGDTLYIRAKKVVYATPPKVGIIPPFEI
jgi:hypothetical protein